MVPIGKEREKEREKRGKKERKEGRKKERKEKKEKASKQASKQAGGRKPRVLKKEKDGAPKAEGEQKKWFPSVSVPREHPSRPPNVCQIRCLSLRPTLQDKKIGLSQLCIEFPPDSGSPH